MNLKKSWVNLPLLKNIIKQNTLLPKISLIAVFAFGIMGIAGDYLSALAVATFGLSAIILTTCLAGLVQKYMTNKNEANFVASLPLDSFVLWFTHYLAGLLLVVIPLWIESIIIAWLPTFYGMNGTISFVFTIQITTILLAIIYYTISFFVSCMAGNRFGQFIYTVVFYALPFLVYLAIALSGQIMAPGSYNAFDFNTVELFIPLISGLNFISLDNWPYGIWHLIITIGFFIGGYYVFKNRSIENTGEALLYKKINIGLRVLLVITATLLSFTILSRLIAIMPNYAISSILIGGIIFVVLGSLFALLVEIIFKNPHMYKSLVYYLPVLLISYLGCYFYGQYAFEAIQEKVYVGEEVNFSIYYYNRDETNSYLTDQHRVALKTKDAKKIIDEIQEDREKMLKIDWFVQSKDYIQVEVSNIKNNQYDSDSFYIEVEVAYFDEILEKHRDAFKNTMDIATVTQIENSDQEYWYLYNENLYEDEHIVQEKELLAVLTKAEVQDIVGYMQSDEYKQEENLYFTNYQLQTKTGEYRIGIGDVYMDRVYQNEAIIVRTEQLRSCLDKISPYNTTVFEEVLKEVPFLKEIQASDGFNMEDIILAKDVTYIDETTVAIKAIYTYYDDIKGKTVKQECIVTFTLQDEEMKVVQVEGGETDVGTI